MNNIKRMNRLALIFDVETTGLIKHGEPYPHIIQLSFVLFDTIENQSIMTYDTIVRPSEEIVLSDKIKELTGIKEEDIVNGTHIVQVLGIFFEMIKIADVIVGHNIDFDKKMIALEVMRMCPILKTKDDIHISLSHLFNEKKGKGLLNIWYLYIFHKIKEGPIDEYCTMHNSEKICNILKKNSRGSYIKWPSLAETHNHLFGKVPDNLHNSLVDTIACLRCYIKLYKNEDIGEIIVN